MYERPRVNVKVERVSGFEFAPLASAETSSCCGEAGEKEKESARGMMGRGKREEPFPAFSLFPSSTRAFNFFDYCYFYRDTQREPLRRRERSRDTFHTWKPQRKRVEKVYNNWYYTWASNVFTVWHKFSGEQSTNPGEISYKKKIVVGGVIFSSLNFGKWAKVTQGKKTSKKRQSCQLFGPRAISHDKNRKNICAYQYQLFYN